MSADIVRFSESSMCETASSAFLPASPVEILNRRKHQYTYPYRQTKLTTLRAKKN